MTVRIFRQAVDVEYCDTIVDLAKTKLQKKEAVQTYNDTIVRNNLVYWLDHRKTPYLTSVLYSLVQAYNEETKFAITDSFIEKTQICCYQPGQFYDWHMDIGDPPITNRRKISLVLELQRSENFVGEGLKIWDLDESLAPGDVVLFPSYIMHRVGKVEVGTRWSLVQWVLGEQPFK